MKNKKKGFTLVELIVVLAILAILAAMLVPALTGYIDKANEKKVLATARQYAIAAQSTVSDAYASNDVISKIYVDGTASDAVTYSGTRGSTKDWLASYKALAEMKSGDKASFEVSTDAATKGQLKNGSKVLSGGYTASYDGTNWTASKGDSFTPTNPSN